MAGFLSHECYRNRAYYSKINCLAISIFFCVGGGGAIGKWEHIYARARCFSVFSIFLFFLHWFLCLPSLLAPSLSVDCVDDEIRKIRQHHKNHIPSALVFLLRPPLPLLLSPRNDDGKTPKFHLMPNGHYGFNISSGFYFVLIWSNLRISNFAQSPFSSYQLNTLLYSSRLGDRQCHSLDLLLAHIGVESQTHTYKHTHADILFRTHKTKVDR